MFNKIIPVILFAVLLINGSWGFAQVTYPSWTYSMKVWPFDILYPFDTGFANLNEENATTDSQIRDRLDVAKNKGANVVIFYIDDEQSYETFVDENGFGQTLQRIQFLVNEAHNRDLKVVCYLNGLEVITVGAKTNQSMPSFARNYPEWLQIDIENNTMVWYTTSQTSWIPENSEDAWASPLSPWRDFFKNRLTALGSTGLDGVYIDATFLPGVEDFGIKWASRDPYFETAFYNQFGTNIPTSVDWNSSNWRKFVYFRHEVIRNYLGEMAETARANGMTAFFESSSCDYVSGTYLGNDVPFTISGGIACSPEIEPEGDFKAAFRMSKATRDANQTFPMWYLGWPGNSKDARKEFAITLCHSGNYYPTTDAQSYYPENAFPFMELLKDSIMSNRLPYQNTALIYPMRSKDYTFSGESTFESYIDAFTILEEKHIPFRILPLETMTAIDLEGINNVILAGVESISDSEYNLLKNKTISLVGTNGTTDEWGDNRTETLNFPNVADISSLAPNLKFSIQASSNSYLEYYINKSDSNHYFIFAYNDNQSGEIVIDNSTLMTGKIVELDKTIQNISGTSLTIPIDDYLTIVELRLSNSTAIENNYYLDALDIQQNFTLLNVPNPFNASTSFHFNMLKSEFVTLKIFNLRGQEIKTVLNKYFIAGTHNVPFAAENLSSGIYLAQLRCEQKIITKRIVLLR